MALPDFSAIKSEKILIDSCVLLYCGDSAIGDKTKPILRGLANSKNALAISTICLFEVLKHRLDSKNFDYYSLLLRYLHPIAVHTPALTNAAKLGQLYNDGKKETEDLRRAAEKSAHTGDLLIGGTAIYHKALVLTADKAEGFTWRFWEPVAHQCILFEHSNEMKVINLYLLRFKLQNTLPTGFLTVDTHELGKPVSLGKVRGKAPSSV